MFMKLLRRVRALCIATGLSKDETALETGKEQALAGRHDELCVGAQQQRGEGPSCLIGIDSELTPDLLGLPLSGHSPV